MTTTDLDPPGTFRRFAYDELSSGPLLGYFGRRLQGVISLSCDSLMEALTQAIESAWVHSTIAPDSLGLIGRELRLPRYPVESNAQYQARLQRAWEDLLFAGGASAIIGQLAAAGFPGAQIFRWGSDGSWSEFVVFFPQGTHTVTSSGPAYGSFTYGDGTTYGPIGITPDQLNTIRGIIKKWKPGRWVCKRIVWEISGWTYGSGHNYGDVGLVYGGSQAVAGV